eukprot:TRINITY_DN520_c0_g1_i2.p1 TRINITY_DN520_c0_g1~~TRINITY_DN520_c0_g1_i2.p1  ORF type:complete len:573 (-),score=119.10 TRINITY_DN520_c0_g1_i2:2322-4040(-)
MMRVYTIGLIIVILAVLVTSECPNDCSFHGNCINDACVCTNDWTGNDCSISLRTLVPGSQGLSGEVELYDWQYFKVNTGFGSGDLVFKLRASGDADSDCDLYIKYGDLPSRINYDVRDINDSTESTLKIENPDSGTYYAGVFGYIGGRFVISVEFEGSCNVLCEHGACRDGKCVCDEGYFGESCQVRADVIQLGQLVSGSVESTAWKYYVLSVRNSFTSLVFDLTQTTSDSDADCDLFLRYANPPTLLEWDASDRNFQEPNSTVRIVEPALGEWFVGINGWSSCQYELVAKQEIGCADFCSNHGTCRSSTCVCDSQYKGINCEEKKDPLESNEVVSGFVGVDAWNFYTFDSNTQSNILIKLNQESADSDCDIYVKAGAKPSYFDFDFMEISYSQNVTLEITEPGQNEWNIGVYGSTACTYDLSVVESSQCTCVHGTCTSSGTCICEPGWSGPNCDKESIEINSGVAVNGTIVRNAWEIYEFSTAAKSVFISVKEESESGGTVYLFVGRDYIPTAFIYDYSDLSDEKFHHIEYTLDELPTGPVRTFYIGVYGSPYIERPVDYTVVAWVPPFPN